MRISANFCTAFRSDVLSRLYVVQETSVNSIDGYFLGDAYRIVHSALRRSVFSLPRRLPVFKGEFRGGTRCQRALPIRRSMLGCMEVLNPVRRLDGAIWSWTTCRHGFPAAETGRGLMLHEPGGTPGRKGHWFDVRSPEGSGQERTRSNPSGNHGAGRQALHSAPMLAPVSRSFISD